MNPELQRIIKGKLQHKEGNYAPEKARKQSCNKPKRRQLQEQKPTLTTKITESNNYFALISLNINGLAPLNKNRLIG